MTDNEMKTPAEELQTPATDNNQECAETTSPAMDLAEVADKIETADNEQGNACTREAECTETTSPAMDLAEAADEITDGSQCSREAECAETTSPAMDLAEAADELTDDQPERHPRLGSMDKKELIETLRTIVNEQRADAHREVAAIKKAYFLIRNREETKEMEEFVAAGNAPETFSATPDPDEAELKDLLAVFREKRNAYLEEEATRRQANLDAKREIITKLQALADDIDNINLHFSEFHDLQQQFRAIGEVPPTNETEIWKAYQQVEELFFDRLKMNKELRDLDFKKNLEAKQAIVAQAQALTEAPDVIAAFRKLQSLHEAWRETGPVGKEMREKIWDEFKKASTIINKRHQDYFEARKAQEQINEEAKLALCDEVEAINPDALQSYQAWDEATEKVKDIQARWRKLGFASRKTNTALFARFRQACDTFFARKADYYKQAREENNANIAKKRELIERVEALLSDVADRKNAEAVAALQEEWKKTGHIARRQGEALWERFNAACNKFYAERKKTFGARHQEENANLEAKRGIIAKLRELLQNENRRELLPQVRELQEQWKNIGFVPRKLMDEVFKEYRNLCDDFYESLDREPRRQRNNGQERGRRQNDRPSAPMTERDRLIRDYDERRTELQTLENNLGFFNVKSKAGNSMVAEIERKIERLRTQMADIAAKVKALEIEAAKAAKNTEAEGGPEA